MGCGATVVKVILFVANVLFALAGVALAGAGVAALLAASDEGLVEREARAACVAAAVVGCLIVVAAVLGCCGAVTENRTVLVIYSVLLVVLAVVKTVLAVLAFAMAAALRGAARDVLERLFKERNDTDVFSKIERHLQCCGLDGTKSYYYAPPPSCCARAAPCSLQRAFVRGCADAAGDAVGAYAAAVGSLCLGVVIVELLAVTFGLCLASRVNRYKGRY